MVFWRHFPLVALESRGGCHKRRQRAPVGALESDTWGAREHHLGRPRAGWGPLGAPESGEVEEGRRYFVHLGRQRAGWGHLGRQRVTKLRRGGGILSTWAAREQVGATWGARERWS